MPIDSDHLKDVLKEREAISKKRLYCNWCRQETNHEVKGYHPAVFSVDPDFDPDLQEASIYRLWICMGCDRGLLEEEYVPFKGMPPGEDVQYFPKRSHDTIVPKRYSKLKPGLEAIYREALTCYNERAPILCAAGLRALLEGICQDKRIKGTNLGTKIDGLNTVLPNKNIIRNLHHFRFMGNEAVHELAAPKPEELALAIDVIEDLLNFLYEMDYKSSRLRALRRRPRRSKPTRAVTAIPTPANPQSSSDGSKLT